MENFDPYEQWLGIPPTLRPIDYYTLLGIEKFCEDRRKIQEAAEARMRLLRKYQTGPRGVYTQPLLNEIAQAKLRLLDPRRKAEYDERLRESAAWAAELATQDEGVLTPPEVHVPFSSGVWLAPQIPIAGATPSLVIGTGARPTSTASNPVAVTDRAGVPHNPRLISVSARRTPQARAALRRKLWLGYLGLASTFVLTVVVAVSFWCAWKRGWLNQRFGSREPLADASKPSLEKDNKIVVPDLEGTIHLLPDMAATPNTARDGSNDARANSQVIEWLFAVAGTSMFEAVLSYQLEGNVQQAQCQLTLDGQATKTIDLLPAESGQLAEMRTYLMIRGAGVHRLAINLPPADGEFSVRLHALLLKPVKMAR